MIRIFFFIPVLFLFTACSTYERQQTVSQESRMVVVPASTFAMSTPATPSSPCAQNVDDILTHLEKLMANKSVQSSQAGD